jgi:Holliday junction DNA helicase RuvB
LEPSRRLIAPEKREDDLETSLRPLALADFTGQRAARANLQVFIEAAKSRGDALDHVLFVGPRASARQRWRRSSPASSG